MLSVINHISAFRKRLLIPTLSVLFCTDFTGQLYSVWHGGLSVRALDL